METLTFETFPAPHLPEGLGHEHLYPLGVEVPDRPGVRVQVPRGPALATVEWSRDQLWTNHSSPRHVISSGPITAHLVT